jgi:S-adenosylmethionine-diacylglycerol 3-amino-3-carboxypropyl transferase
VTAAARAGFGGRLLYSQCWEDVACARAALRIRPGHVVLAIGAAGDNVLALLLDQPARVVALDANPAQAALVELKAAAVRRLSAVGVARFLGAAPSPARLADYERLRPDLCPAARQYWDRAPSALAAGVIHSGRFERYLALFRKLVLPLVPGRRTLRAMLAAADLDEQRRIYARGWDSAAWRTIFRVFFSRRLLAARGRHPAFFAHCAVADLGSHYLERCRVGLTDIPIRDNPYLGYMLAGTYDRPHRLPTYLQPESVAMLRPALGRLAVETATLADALAALPARSVDAFYLSDVFEAFSPSEYEAALAEIARVGRPGARICYWNNLVDRRRSERLAGLLASHAREAAALHRRDRAFLYTRFVVESVRAAA